MGTAPPVTLQGSRLRFRHGWTLLLIVEAVVLVILVFLTTDAVSFSVFWLALAILSFVVQVCLVIPAVLSTETARTHDYKFWTCVVFFAASILFITSIEHRPHTVVDQGTMPQPQATPQSKTQSQPPPAVLPPAVANSIDDSWVRGLPKTNVYTMSDGLDCGPNGHGEDTLTNIRKNRIDVPAAYYDVQWEAIAGVYFPRDKVMPKSLVRWSADEILKIMKFEDIPVRAVGYIKTIRPQTGNKESTNCNATKAADTDWHIAFVEHARDPELSSIVVEVTPRVRLKHPAWTKKNLSPWIDWPFPVRFSGWLLFDPEHKNHLGRFRQTLWEIHPITRIELQSRDGNWIDLDTMGMVPPRMGRPKK